MTAGGTPPDVRPVGTAGTGDVADPLLDSTSLDARANAFLAANPVAGLSVAIVRTDDEPLLWTGHYGVRDVESGAPVDEDTSFWLGSVSKTVMGVALMIARERGFLDLDDDVRALLDANGGFSIDGPSTRPITFAQLASHTSGIVDAEAYACAYHFIGPDGEPSREILDPDGDPLVDADCPGPIETTLEGFLCSYLEAGGALYDADANFAPGEPGEAMRYSNVGAALVGHAIGLAAGRDLAAFAAREIFAPLGMRRTSWRSTDLDPANVATPYLDLGDAPFALPKYELATWPDGGLRSNAADLAALLGALMRDRRADGSSAVLLRPESIERMLPADGAGYGLFVSGDCAPFAGESRRVLGHAGSDPGAFAFLLFDPEADIGVALTANGDDDEVDGAALEALLAALFESGRALGAGSR